MKQRYDKRMARLRRKEEERQASLRSGGIRKKRPVSCVPRPAEQPAGMRLTIGGVEIPTDIARFTIDRYPFTGVKIVFENPPSARPMPDKAERAVEETPGWFWGDGDKLGDADDIGFLPFNFTFKKVRLIRHQGMIVAVKVDFQTLDVTSGDPLDLTYTHRLPEATSDRYMVATAVRKAMLAATEHEVSESLLFRGYQLVDPHPEQWSGEFKRPSALPEEKVA